MRALILISLLLGCTTKGGLYESFGVEYSDIKCEKTEPYYLDVTIKTDFELMKQQAIVSWQCSDKDRHYIYLDEYSLSMDTK